MNRRKEGRKEERRRAVGSVNSKRVRSKSRGSRCSQGTSEEGS
jgi:hypothetical protein